MVTTGDRVDDAGTGDSADQTLLVLTVLASCYPVKHWHQIKQSLPGSGLVDHDGACEVLTVLTTGDRAGQALLMLTVLTVLTVLTRRYLVKH